jgi:enoyl-CoA hydratase
MTYENILIEPKGQHLVLILNRPEALNALNSALMKELDHFFTKGYKHHSDLRCIIITGAGNRAFAAGADIKEFIGLNAEQGQGLAEFGHKVFNQIEQFHLPVIAAVNGFALGGGCELAMSCHIRLASENAKFGQPEVNLGLIPGYGGTQRLIHCIGKSKAVELLMTADMLTAEQALQYGLVTRVIPQEELMQEAMVLATKLATKAPVALSQLIRCINACFHEGEDGFKVKIKAFGHCTATEDFKEGAAAFVEKRPAHFTGK